MPRGTILGFVLGILLGGTGGAVLGAHLGSWTGGLIGGYGGILCGMCVLGGLAGIASRQADEQDRGEAVISLAFGGCAAIGAVAGYWAGTSGVPRLSPWGGFFAGLCALGSIAGIAAAKAVIETTEPAILMVLLFAPIGAGFGVWAATAIGSPVAIGIGLVGGNVVGAGMAHVINVGISDAYKPQDPGCGNW